MTLAVPQLPLRPQTEDRCAAENAANEDAAPNNPGHVPAFLRRHGVFFCGKPLHRFILTRVQSFRDVAVPGGGS